MRRGRRRSALDKRLTSCQAAWCPVIPGKGDNMNEELRARALRAAAAVLDELGTTPTTRDELVTALAAAWLDGNNAGLSDALSIVGREKVPA